jgi:transcriptional regulator with XRE-family HTH domain
MAIRAALRELQTKAGAPASFGAQLKALREGAGFTQEALANYRRAFGPRGERARAGERRQPHVETVRALTAVLDLTGAARDACVYRRTRGPDRCIADRYRSGSQLEATYPRAIHRSSENLAGARFREGDGRHGIFDRTSRSSPVEVHSIVDPAPMGDFDRVYVRELPPLTTLVVETRNSSYRIVVKEDSSICVQGGPYFPEPTPAHLDGARLLGTGLQVDWLEVGLLMMITAGAKHFVTSPIRAITTEHGAASNDEGRSRL